MSKAKPQLTLKNHKLPEYGNLNEVRNAINDFWETLTPNQQANADFEYQSGDSWNSRELYISYEVMETQEEADKRVNDAKTQAERNAQWRRNQYEQLKKEFEGE